MIVVDENIVADQRELLRSWRIRFRQIGIDVGRLGIRDEEIIPLLLELPQPTFFTRDIGWYRRPLAHPRYSVAVLGVPATQAALFARRVLRHPDFNTAAKRMGTLLRASHEGISAYSVREDREFHRRWV